MLMTESVLPKINPGILVRHPGKPEWGLGRVLDVQGTKVKVYFRDLPGDHPEAAVIILDTRYVALEVTVVQSDPFLDNLPPYRDGRFVQPPKTRVTLEQGIMKFHSLFPLLFKDRAYIGDAKSGERWYKWAAHQLFETTLGNDQIGALLASDGVDEVRHRALAVEGRTNLLAVFEKAALRDGLRDDAAATKYFNSLRKVLNTPVIEPGSFSDYLAAVEDLPSGGGTSPAKWTVATILPYLAQPHRFMFLKPLVTQDCAARLTFDLAYSTELSWNTYSRLLEMSKCLLDFLQPYGAVDFIDVQSFIWVIGGGWER
jgi:hypothetical protein